jgi:hypothetical protein
LCAFVVVIDLIWNLNVSSIILALTLILWLCRWVTLPKKSLCIFCVDRVLVSQGEAPNTGELLCINVEDGKLVWDSFLGRSEKILEFNLIIISWH